MTVLSLFDGMSCGQIALRELGIVPDRYYASEIDKHAIKQTQFAFPDTIQLGDVTGWREWDIDWSKINLLLAGSPCQGFSFCGKQLAFDDPRSVLFFVFVDILNHIRKFNPNVVFLLENVNMKKSHLRVINDILGIMPVHIDSALISAQHRERYYWSNVRTRREGLFGQLHTDVPQPADRGLAIADILDDDVPAKYYLSEQRIKTLLAHMERQKENGTGFGARIPCAEEKANAVIVGGKCQNDLICISSTQAHSTISTDKAPALTAAMGMGGGHVPMIMQVPRGKNTGGIHSVAPTLSANSYQQNNLVIQFNPAQEFGTQPRNQNRFYSIEGESPTLNTVGGGNLETKVYTQGTIRRLTPQECAKLQTIPAWYRWNPEISETQIYKMLGNGWTVAVISHILQYLKPQTA